MMRTEVQITRKIAKCLTGQEKNLSGFLQCIGMLHQVIEMEAGN